MQCAHLRIVCQLVRVGVTLKQEELDDLYGCILDCQVQEALAHHVKAVKHLAAATLILHLKHLVHLDKLFRLIVLDELYKKARSLDDTLRFNNVLCLPLRARVASPPYSQRCPGLLLKALQQLLLVRLVERTHSGRDFAACPQLPPLAT